MFAASKTASVSGGYQISRSLRFNSADSAYLNRTPASAGNRKTFTFSAWVKRSFVGTGADNSLFDSYVDNSNRFDITFGGTGNAQLYISNVAAGSTTMQIGTSAVFRDASAWYHIVFSVDTTQATSTNRAVIYVNGVAQTVTGTYPSQNADLIFNYAIQHTIGAAGYSGLTNYLGAYMTEVNFIDGSQLTPSSFGETNAQTGVWQPKAYSGSYGTNGFYLNFSDNSNTTAATLGKDYSGNGNNWTPNNFSVSAGAGNDSLVDSPTNYGTDSGVGGDVRGNYCTWNPISVYGASAANGNLDATVVGSGNAGKAVANGTIAVSSGKWYWEITPISGNGYFIGVSDPSGAVDQRAYNSTNGWGYFTNGNKYTNNTGVAYGASYTGNDVIGVALDMDNGTLTFYKNNSSQGTAYTGLNTGRSLTPYVGDGSGSTNQVYYANFGQRPFAYTAPSGYKALCTQNLPTPTIGATTATQAGKFFNPVIYSGDGGTRSITGVGFQPDFVWIKSRSNAVDHALYDSRRGALQLLQSNLTSAEATYANSLTAFNADGFSLGGSTDVNANGYTFVAWNWKANGSGSSNTSGSITSTVSANTTSGFSVVTYTGTGANATVGHGLGVAPSMIFVKQRANQSGYNWFVYNQSIGNTQWLILNDTRAASSAVPAWNNTTPTSSVFSIGSYDEVNRSTSTFVAYCFAEIAGYSKIGSYNGNSSTDGPFIFTGFRPAYVMIKRTDTADQWSIYDSARNPNNLTNILLYANLSNADDVGTAGIDMVSNGFKLRATYSNTNASGGTYIFMAFASSPFKFSLAK